MVNLEKDRVCFVEDSFGFSEEEISSLRAKEASMRRLDAEIQAVLSSRNQLEAYILEMRSAPRQRHGEKIDAEKLNALLDEHESWLWDSEQAALSLEAVSSRYESLRSQAEVLCKEYFELVCADRERAEKALEEESIRSAAERAAAGGEDGDDAEDHDFRKLKKADRMRLVMKNKDEGNELFKGGNYRPAAARYHKALTHTAKFFDLSKEDETEVESLKKTLHLNLASCYLKLENWEQALRNCEDALHIDPLNVKALFRRSQYFEHKKDFERALTDVKKCQELAETEDKMVTKASERIKKELQKEKNKEKKMWGKAFS